MKGIRNEGKGNNDKEKEEEETPEEKAEKWKKKMKTRESFQRKEWRWDKRPSYHDLTSAASRNVDTLEDIHSKDAKIIEDMERALNSWNVYSNVVSAEAPTITCPIEPTTGRRGSYGSLMASDEDIGMKAAEVALASRFSVNDCLALKSKLKTNRSLRKLSSIGSVNSKVSESITSPGRNPEKEEIFYSNAVPPVSSFYQPESMSEQTIHSEMMNEDSTSAVAPLVTLSNIITKQAEEHLTMLKTPSPITAQRSKDTRLSQSSPRTSTPRDSSPRKLAQQNLQQQQSPRSLGSLPPIATKVNEMENHERISLPSILLKQTKSEFALAKPSLFGANVAASNQKLDSVRKFNELRRKRRTHNHYVDSSTIDSGAESTETRTPERSGARALTEDDSDGEFENDYESKHIAQTSTESEAQQRSQACNKNDASSDDEDDKFDLERLRQQEAEILQQQKLLLENQFIQERPTISVLGKSNSLQDFDSLPSIHSNRMTWEKAKKLHTIALKKHLEEQQRLQEAARLAAVIRPTSSAGGIDNQLYQLYLDSQQQTRQPVRSKSANSLSKLSQRSPNESIRPASAAAEILSPLGSKQVEYEGARSTGENLDVVKPSIGKIKRVQQKRPSSATPVMRDSLRNESTDDDVADCNQGDDQVLIGSVNSRSETATNELARKENNNRKIKRVKKKTKSGPKSKKSSELDRLSLLSSSVENDEEWFERVMQENRRLRSGKDPKPLKMDLTARPCVTHIEPETRVCLETEPLESAAETAQSHFEISEGDDDSLFVSDTDSNCASSVNSPQRSVPASSQDEAAAVMESFLVSPFYGTGSLSKSFDNTGNGLMHSSDPFINLSAARDIDESIKLPGIVTLASDLSYPDNKILTFGPGSEGQFFDFKTSTSSKGRHNVTEARLFNAASLQIRRDLEESNVSILFGRRRSPTESSKPCTPAASPVRGNPCWQDSNQLEVVAVLFDRFIFDEKAAYQWWQANKERVVEDISGIDRLC